MSFVVDDGVGVFRRPLDGPDMPSNNFTAHELLKYFKDYFDFDTDKTMTIMGVHAVGVEHHKKISFTNLDAHDGW